MNKVKHASVLFFILFVTSRINCYLTVSTSEAQKKEFTMIFGAGKKVVSLKSHHKPEESDELWKNNNNKVSFVAKYKDELFVSTKATWDFLTADSVVRRYKINITSTYDNSSKIKLKEIETYPHEGLNVDILSIVVVKNYIFNGNSNGHLRRCSLNKDSNGTRYCESVDETAINLAGRHADINGLDYNPADDKIYASLSTGTLWRCSWNSSNTCREVFVADTGLSAVKIAFGDIWVGTKSGQLIRCSTIENGRVRCSEFDHTKDGSGVLSIDAANGDLYVNLDRDDMWRCDISQPGSCGGVFSTPDGSASFIIL